MAPALPLVDTNVFVRHFRQDHPDQSPRATAYMQRIRRGELVAPTNELVLSETVHILQSIYQMTKPAIAEALLTLIALPNLKILHKARLRKTFDWYVRYNVSFIDAYLSVLTQQQELPELVSFDRNYDRIPGIARVEPQDSRPYGAPQARCMWTEVTTNDHRVPGLSVTPI
jgi:predicted nucleic acid-binding protein